MTSTTGNAKMEIIINPADLKMCLANVKGKIAGDAECTRAYEKMGSLHYCINGVKDTLLHCSIESNDVSTTRWLIDYGLDIDAQNICGETPLMRAASEDNEDICRLLLKANASIELVDRFGRNVLQSVYYENLYDGSSIPGALLMKFLDKCESTKEAADKLFKANCPLSVAVLARNTKITKYLLNRGVKIHPILEDCRYDISALHVAVHFHDLKTVKLLLRHGANANELDTSWYTPMALLRDFWDYKDKQTKILKALLDAGADVSALVSASQYMQVYPVLRHCNKEAIDLLLRAKDDLPVKDGLDFTPLHYLAGNVNPGVFELLEDQTFDVHARNVENQTALEIAVSIGNVQAVRFLLARGADPNGLTGRGETILYSAVMRRNEKCVEMLLQRGAEARMEIFNDVLVYGNFNLIQPILAHLALIEATGTTIDNEVSRKIEANVPFQRSFDLYRQQLENFKKSVICDTVTMFKLLTESETKFLFYLRNRQLVSNWKCIDRENTDDTYYYRRVQERVKSGLRIMQLRRRAARVLCEIMRLRVNAHPLIIDEIFSYVSERDLQRLAQVQNDRNVVRKRC